MTAKPLPFAAAAINEEAVFWLNAPQATKDAIIARGGCAPCITDNDRYVAAQRAAPQPKPVAKP